MRRFILLTAAVLPSVLLAGGAAIPKSCSVSDAGAAVLNEVKVSGGGSDPIAFVEIKTLLDNTDIANWQICIDSPSNCVTLGLGGGTWSDGINVRADNDSPFGNTTYPANYWITYPISANPSEDEIILMDSSGDVIDYVHYVQNSQGCGKDLDWDVPSACGLCFIGRNASDKDFARLPDGSGGWGNNGDTPSDGTSNDGSTPPLPSTIGEWWFDEPSWSGAPGEVTDQTTNGLNMTMYNNALNDDVAPALSGDPGSCRYGDFSGNSYLETPDSPALDLQTFTAAIWIHPRRYPSSGLMTIVSKDENFEFHLDNNGEIFWWWGSGSRNLRTSGAGIPTNAWTHVAISYRNGEQVIYINGAPAATKAWTGTLTVNSDPLQVGQDQFYPGRYFDGYLDEFFLFDRNLIPREVQQTMNNRHPCPITPAIDRFDITHDNNALNCYREAITISAVDSSGNVVTNYAGLVNLSVSTGNGEWFVTDDFGSSADPAQGALTNSGSLDGVATYNFAPGDNGSVVLYIRNTINEAVNIDASQGAFSDDDTEGLLTFRPTGFTVSVIPTQIAGRPFAASLTAVGQDPNASICRVITEYTGTKTIHFWTNKVTPVTTPVNLTINSISIGNSEPTASPTSVTFANGVGTMNLQYDDVGEIGFSAKDETGIGDPVTGTNDEIIGGVIPFVVRPFAFDIQPNGNPDGITTPDPAYGVAGEPFLNTFRSVLWQASDDTNNDGIPDDFSALNDNGITPSINQINGTINLTHSAQLVNNSNGTLSPTSIDFTTFQTNGASPGTTLDTALTWDEVGILTLNATAIDFMGSGENVPGQRSNIGRFTPKEFILTLSDDFTPQCSSLFTYGGFNNGVPGLDKNGQLDNVAISVQAVNALGNPTRNYDGQFAKLESGVVTTSGINSVSTLPVTGTMNATQSIGEFDTNGSSTINLVNVDYQFEDYLAPFSLRLDINALDSDSVSGSVSTSSVEIRLGRVIIDSAYGSELELLEVPVYTEFFDGTQWLLNTNDGCTNFINSELTFVATSYQGDLNAGETSVILPSPTASYVSNGKTQIGDGFWLSPPGLGNSGEVQVEFDLTALSWLSFDWNGDNTIDNPQASISFGRYRGSDRVIYWKEK